MYVAVRLDWVRCADAVLQRCTRAGHINKDQRCFWIAISTPTLSMTWVVGFNNRPRTGVDQVGSDNTDCVAFYGHQCPLYSFTAGNRENVYLVIYFYSQHFRLLLSTDFTKLFHLVCTLAQVESLPRWFFSKCPIITQLNSNLLCGTKFLCPGAANVAELQDKTENCMMMSFLLGAV